MNAIDFGHTSDREFNRGICMWVAGDPNRNKGEWCAKPLVVENYRGSFNTPANNNTWGALYGIHVPNGIPEHESMWICDKHRHEFLKLNSKGNLGTTIWKFDYYGQGTEVTWTTMFEVSVRIRTNKLDSEGLSAKLKGELIELMKQDDDLDSWSYLKVVEVS